MVTGNLPRNLCAGQHVHPDVWSQRDGRKHRVSTEDRETGVLMRCWQAGQPGKIQRVRACSAYCAGVLPHRGSRVCGHFFGGDECCVCHCLRGTANLHCLPETTGSSTVRKQCRDSRRFPGKQWHTRGCQNRWPHRGSRAALIGPSTKLPYSIGRRTQVGSQAARARIARWRMPSVKW